MKFTALRPLSMFVLIVGFSQHSHANDDKNTQEFVLEKASTPYGDSSVDNNYQQIAQPLGKTKMMYSRPKRFTYDFDDSSWDDKTLKVNFRIRFF